MIYEPSGRALEYSPLACNLYTGCVHGCKYCYAPQCLHTTVEQFGKAAPRAKALSRLEKSASKFAGDQREINLCFTCDPYQPDIEDITRASLLIMERHRLRATLLTKGGTRACRDFDILARNGWKFGSTITGSWQSARIFEPYAAPVQDRIEAVKRAKKAGIFTYLSVEPVMFPEEALVMMAVLKPYVDFWKVGKINHVDRCRFNEETKAQIFRINWRVFLERVVLQLSGCQYYIKKDLIEAAKKGTT